jgi:hypothetical protein
VATIAAVAGAEVMATGITERRSFAAADATGAPAGAAPSARIDISPVGVTLRTIENKHQVRRTTGALFLWPSATSADAAKVLVKQPFSIADGAPCPRTA